MFRSRGAPWLWLALVCSAGAAKEDSHSPKAALDAAEAREAYSKILLEAPGDLVAACGRIRALLALDEWPMALVEARALAARTPDSGEARVVLAESEYRAGRIAASSRLLESVLSGTVASPAALVLAGRLRKAEGRIVEARALLDRAIAEAPNDSSALWWGAETAATRTLTIARFSEWLRRVGDRNSERAAIARATVGLLQALGAREVWRRAAAPERATIALDPLWDPLTGEIQGWLIPTKVGQLKKPVRLLIDTGATGVVLLGRIARRGGFLPLAAGHSVGGGGDGVQRSPRGLMPALEFGPLGYLDPLVTLVDQEIDPTGRYHGVVGLAAFDGYRVTLDLFAGTLLIEPPGELPGSTPYWVVEGQLLVEAVVGSREPDLFLLDTGHTRTLVSTRAVRTLDGALMGPAVAVQAIGGRLAGARALSGVPVRFQSGEVGPRDLVTADLDARNRAAGIEVAGFVGLDLLGGRRLVLDTGSRRVRLDPPEPESKRRPRRAAR